MVKNKPRVSIGLPVYNGEKTLETALNAILAQTYNDFELIISDNASTDKTQEICLRFAAQDSRIGYFRNEHDIGLTRNFNRVFELSHGEYLAFAAHDDYIAPDFISRCVEVLDNDPSIILCHSRVSIIDEQGESRELDKKMCFPNEGSPFPHKRFKDLIMINHPCLESYGLMRTSSLTFTPIYESYYGSDRNFLAELSLIGKFYHIPDVLFFWHDELMKYWKFDSWLGRISMWQSWANRIDPSKPKTIPIPRWDYLRGYLRSLNRVKLNRKELIKCYLVLVEWTIIHAKGIVKDVLVAVLIMINQLAKSIKKILLYRYTFNHLF